jgi:hypothetical protein
MPDNQDVKIAELATKLEFIQRDIEFLKTWMGWIKDKLEENSDKIFNSLLKIWKDTENKFVTRNEFRIRLIAAQLIVTGLVIVLDRFILK